MAASNPKRRLKRRFGFSSAARICIGYVIFAGLWIYVSDTLIRQLPPVRTLGVDLQTIKGWIFIVGSAGILYLLLKGRATRRRDVPVIETPAEGTLFSVGQRFILRGSGTDPEEGQLAASALTWQVIKHHATHTHPFLEPTVGNDIEIVAPDFEDLDGARTSYLELRLTATDTSGSLGLQPAIACRSSPPA